MSNLGEQKRQLAEKAVKLKKAVTQSGHSPWPWRVGDAGHTIFGPTRAVGMPARIATLEAGPYRRANARLIAAAPELLAALQQAVAYVELVNSEGDSTLSAWLPEAKAALFKCAGLDA